MQETIGLIGSLCFAFSSWPQAYYSWRTQSAKGVKCVLFFYGYLVRFIVQFMHCITTNICFFLIICLVELEL